MARSKLLIHPRKSANGLVHRVTPKTAGWTYVGFEARDLKRGARVSGKTGKMEACIVVLSGRARVTSGKFDSGVVGERDSVFQGLPWSVYLPAHAAYAIEAATNCELATCFAPGGGKLPSRVIGPDDVETLTRGAGSNTRYVRNILSEAAKADSLLVVEVITPAGNWSSYPPHKHDRDALPEESYLEETYYHRISPPQGFALQRVYTDDGKLDETLAVGDRDVVLVPRGYHPVGAPYGYELYYLNVMAGPKRTWRFHNDPAHAWMLV
ncbi:MAG TPA: 5-deoxy-glucuronate isomerase [Roseiarcus sp.]|nr:5-deoxy-glucuronate isomerase [Roseiarcus sp.]